MKNSKTFIASERMCDTRCDIMSECFLCHSVLEPANDAEIEGVGLCVDCCEKLDVVMKDYLSSSPGGYEKRRH